MPRTLFYAGVLSCIITAVSLVAFAAPYRADVGGVLRQIEEFGRGAAMPLVLAMAVVPCAAIFLRMASLLAARNLFSAFLACFAIVTTGASALFLAMVQLRIAVAGRPSGEELLPLRPLVELEVAAATMTALFLSLMFLVLRPYFRLHASPLFSALALCPLPLFAVAWLSPVAGFTAVAAVPVLAATHALLFASTGVHSLRHRHLFLEVTSLRQLFDPRIDPTSEEPRRDLRGMAPQH